jgi:decaprenylphospho-beta-D-erythro-pentofuranosid-2-ulose 2-reductase
MRLLLLGGTSEIGLAIARRLGPERVFLLGRHEGRLAGAAATVGNDAQTRLLGDGAVERAFADAGGFEVVVLAVGVLGAQDGLDADPGEAEEVMRVNFVESGALLLDSLRQLRRQGSGTLVVLSSVAAERARASNAVYGAAKSGLDALAQGLADATAGTGVRLLVIRPGFVKTRMTAGLRPAPFATTPEAVANATARALRGSAHTIWVPAHLRAVFAVLRHLPRPLYRRLPL